MGPHHLVVMYIPVRLDRYGGIALIEVETLSVDFLFVKVQKDAHTHIITSNFHHAINCYCPPSKIHSSSSLNDVI
jgi:hypothetical protein